MAARAIAELLAGNIRQREILVSPAIAEVTAEIETRPVDRRYNWRQRLDRHVGRLRHASNRQSRERCNQRPAPDTHTHTLPSYYPRVASSEFPAGKGVLTHINQNGCDPG